MNYNLCIDILLSRQNDTNTKIEKNYKLFIASKLIKLYTVTQILILLGCHGVTVWDWLN